VGRAFVVGEVEGGFSEKPAETLLPLSHLCLTSVFILFCYFAGRMQGVGLHEKQKESVAWVT